jgi:hypothetical protein
MGGTNKMFIDVIRTEMIKVLEEIREAYNIPRSRFKETLIQKGIIKTEYQYNKAVGWYDPQNKQGASLGRGDGWGKCVHCGQELYGETGYDDPCPACGHDPCRWH